MRIELKGVLTSVGPVQYLGQQKFRMLPVEIEVTEGEYKNIFQVQFFGEKIPKCDISVGDYAEIKASLRSRQSRDGKRFLSLSGYWFNLVRSDEGSAPDEQRDPLDNSDIPF